MTPESRLAQRVNVLPQRHRDTEVNKEATQGKPVVRWRRLRRSSGEAAGKMSSRRQQMELILSGCFAGAKPTFEKLKPARRPASANRCFSLRLSASVATYVGSCQNKSINLH